MANINEELMDAARRGSEVELKALLRSPGCDALAKDSRGTTALMLAASNGRDACVGLLLPLSDALSKDDNGLTALMCAAVYGHEVCIRLLLLPASDALCKDQRGMTALMRAGYFGHRGCVRMLLPASDAWARDASGLTANDLTRNGGHDDLAQFIGAYALSQSEQDSISGVVGTDAPRGRAAPRM